MKVIRIFFLLAAALLFARTSDAQSVTIVQPNGGEVLYACQQYTVTWTQSGGVSNYWNIDYSIDGGIIWASVTSNYLATNGQFLWTVPGVQSTTCLLRIRDALNLTTTDQSNNVFSINFPVIVTSPNGGEVWQGLTSRTITWTGVGTTNYFNIAYSTNGGSTWTNIVTNYFSPSRTYNWTVPNVPSTNCLIRVQDYTQTCMQDISDAVFTISPAQPVITSPNGGENWRPGCSYNITWTTASFYSTVNLEYSADNGTTWNTIATGISNSGAYSWAIPTGIASTQCLVRASNSANTTINDVSNTVFTIVPDIKVTYPNGGEVLYGCSYYNFTWEKGCFTRYKLFYSTDNGVTWVQFATPYVSDNGTLSQSYNFQIPNTINSTTCLFKVEDYYTPTRLDVSNAVFTMMPSNDIVVTSPNGAEVWQGLTPHAITWTSVTPNTYFNLYYSVNGGSTWNTIASAYYVTGTSGTYNWNVPNNPSTNCLVKVEDYYNTCKFDNSNAVFTITPAQPVITSPNGGETWRPGCSYNITWTAASFYSTVNLEYSTDNGTTWNTIATGISNSGAYSWAIPTGIASTQCLVRASNSANTAINDLSNAVFTIVPDIKVTYPNGGEVLYGCSYYNFTWEKGCFTRYKLFYSTDNGVTWVQFATPYVSDNGTLSQSYNFQIPNTINSTTCLFKVEDYYTPTRLDVSNAVFTMMPSNDIVVTSPNGAEVWQGLTPHAITWTSITPNTYFNLYYSVNGGSTWNTITTAYYVTGTSGTYNWNVPNNPSTNCLVKVEDYYNTCKFDNSNAVFTITPAQPIVNSPNGGETWRPGCSYNITWTAASFYSTVNLEYSTDNGTTWNTIATGISNSGAYSWAIPTGIASTQCLVRASNSANTAINDVSNTVFTIVPDIKVTYPNGGEVLYGCSYYNFTWEKGCFTRYKLFYSTDNGVTWVQFATPYVSDNGTLSQSYNFQIPNTINSTTCLFKVEDYYTPTRLDVSNAVFTMMPSNDIVVTSPNGAEVWQGLTPHAITWTSITPNTYFNLYYSVNGGSTWNTITTAYYVTGTSGTYNWNVPNNPSTNCLVKVEDYYNTCKFDNSNAVFTITPAQPIVNSPNGGETWRPGCSYNITWTAASFYSTVNLEYSTDNGTTWNTIATGISNSGAYSWAIPTGIASTQCLVRASNSANTAINDVSNAVFTIVPDIKVTYPNGGEVLYGCSYYNFTWEKGCFTRYKLFYSTDNGVTWVQFATPYVSDNGTLSQSYNFQIPNTINSTTCLFKVEDYYTPSRLDVSNAVFTMMPSNDIVVTSPNGAEVWQGLTPHAITWTSITPNTYFNLYYSVNGGSTWNTITTAYYVTGTSGTYNWNVPNNPSTNCLVKVEDYYNTCKFDNSNAVFTISPAQPVLLIPNGGEVWYGSTTQNITWTAASFYSLVNLELSIDNGVTWSNIATSVSNTGSYSWAIPNTIRSTQCLVRASNSANTAINDVSNNVFTIKPAVTVITPNGDNNVTIWGGCTVTSITFDHAPNYTTFNIQYSLNNGATWTNIVTNYSATANPATYNWSMGNIFTTQALVKVIPTAAPTYFDQSDLTFTIRKPVIIIQPNFGGIMQVGSTYNIMWQSDGISSVYDIFYSSNGGSTWNNIVTGFNTSLNTYPWLVPNTPSTNCLIRVRDNINNCKEDTSNIPFTISTTAPPITLTSPNGNDTIDACTTHTITWTEASPIGTYDIAYSTNGGSTWTNIVTNYSTVTLSYPWAVPNLSSQNVLVRVRSTSNSSIFDLSDALFAIDPWTMTASNDVTICQGQNTTLTASGATSYTWSPATGLSCTTCASPIASPTVTTTYTVTGTRGSCTITDQVLVTVNPTPVANAGTDITICSGSAQLNGSGSGTYLWSPAGSLSNATISNPTASPTVTTTYTLTVTSNGCSSSDQMTLTVGGLIANAGADPTICSGGSTTLNGSGGTSYTWSPATGLSNPNIANPVASPTITTTYTVTVSNGTCSGTDQVTVVVNPTPVADAGLNASICNGGNISLAGSGGTSYTWSPSGSLNNANIANPVATPATTTTYTVNVSNGLCSATDMVTITVNPNPVADAGLNASICNGGSTTLAGSGGTSYTWSPAGSLSNANIANPVATPTTTTTYTVNVSDGTCSATDVVTITVNPTPVADAGLNSAICNGGSVTLSGSGGTSYSWSPAGSLSNANIANPVATPTTTTTYTVNVSDGTCSATDVVTITVNPVPVADAGLNTSICNGGSATLTGSGGTSYTWSPAGSLSNANVANPVATPTTTTTYTVNVSNGLCSSTDVVTVTVNPVPVADAGLNTSICTGGSVILSGSGGIAYSWSPAGSLSNPNVASPVATPTTTTTYTVNVSNGTCSSTDVVTITVNPIPVADAGVNASICNGGSVILSGSGGTTYSWSPAGSLSNANIAGPIATPTVTTTYTVTATTNGCSSTDVVTITVNPAPVADAGLNTSICNGSSVTLSGSGGIAYSWSPAGSLSNPNIASPVATPTTTTTYTVTVSDGTCTATDVVTVTVNPVPVADAGLNASICNGGSATLSGSGGTSYSWSPAGSLSNANIANPVATPTTTTTYAVNVSNGACSSTDVVTITVNPNPVADAGLNASICTGGSVTLSGSGGTSYSWTPAGSLSNANIANPVATPTTTTTYTVNVSDGTCSATDVVTITVNPNPVADAGLNASICMGGSVILSGSGGTSYSWSPAGSLSNATIANPVATPTTTTTYTVNVSDGLCSATDVVTITVNPNPVADAGLNASVCIGGSVTLSASGGTSYSWSPAGSLNNANIANPIATPTTTTTYTVNVSDGTCSATDVVTVTVLPAPAADAGLNASICSGGSATLSGSGGIAYSWSPAGSLNNANIANPVATPASTTTYTVTVSDGTCTATDMVTVTVNSNPVPVITASALSVCSTDSVTLSSSGSGTFVWMPGNFSGSSVTVLPTVTTTYTVTQTDGNTCSGSATETITVVPVPVVAATTSADSICSGSSVTLNATGATTYTWLPLNQNGGTVTDMPVASTTYTLIGSNGGTCNDTTQVNVTVLALPAVSLVLPQDTLCFNDPLYTLTGGSPAGGTYSGNGVSGGQFSAAAAGTGTHTITYQFTDSFGCSDVATQVIYVDICTATGKPEEGTAIQVFPNPTMGMVTVITGSGNAVLELHDMLGQTIGNWQTANGRQEIDLRQQPSGIYFLTVTRGDSQYTVRVVRQ